MFFIVELIRYKRNSLIKLEKGQTEKWKKLASLDNINYIRQKEPKGLGHAVWFARNFIGDEPFAVV